MEKSSVSTQEIENYKRKLRVETLQREVDRLNQAVQDQRDNIATLELANSAMRRRIESLEGIEAPKRHSDDLRDTQRGDTF